MAKDLVKNPLEPANGLLQVPDGIGIGVEVNEEAIKSYLLE
jgi:L-alanine-DL-glutamate epimerase-like enolase superfamily enzyme